MIVGQIQKGEKMGRTLNEDDVLKEIDRWIGYLDEDMITRIKIGIKKLQSAQPERNTGEWIKVKRCEEDTQPNLKCPFCGNIVGWFDLAKYCVGCGAKLEGGAG